MVVSMENQGTKADNWLLGLAVILLVSAIGGQYVFASQPLLLRMIGLVLAIGVAVMLVANTQVGRGFRVYWQESVVELRKVIWPTKQETIHSTLAVLAMVFVMSVVLWSIDAVLVRVMAWIIRQGAM